MRRQVTMMRFGIWHVWAARVVQGQLRGSSARKSPHQDTKGCAGVPWTAEPRVLCYRGRVARGARQLARRPVRSAPAWPSFTPRRRILTALPSSRQTLLFSATMTQSLIALQKAALADAHVFQVSLRQGPARQELSAAVTGSHVGGHLRAGAVRSCVPCMAHGLGPCVRVPAASLPQAYEGLKTASKLKEEYLFLPAKVGHVRACVAAASPSPGRVSSARQSVPTPLEIGGP